MKGNKLILNTRMLFCLAILLILKSQVMAIHEKKHVPWGIELKEGPDSVTGGWFLNLGPTGLRAQITHQHPSYFTIKYVFKDSPAYKKIKKGDIVVAVNGKKFTTPHTFGRSTSGWEGPVLSMAKEVENSQASDGKLVLSIWPNGKKAKQKDVTLGIKIVGRFSTTYPYNCLRSEKLLRQLCDYLANRIKTNDFKIGPHGTTHTMLALMASGNPKYKGIVKDYAVKLAKRKYDGTDGGGLPSWGFGLDGIFMGEYSILNRDKSLRKAMMSLNKAMKLAQDPANGAYSHKPYPFIQKRIASGGPAGYGSMASPAGLIMLGLTLMHKSGIKIYEETYEKIHKGFLSTSGPSHKGEVNYGLKPINKSMPEPTRPYQTDENASGIGRHHAAAGAAALAHYIANRSQSWNYLADHLSTYCNGVYKGIHDGHASATLHVTWGTLGAAMGKAESFRRYMDYNKWWFIMAETHDGSFALYPGRDYSPSDPNYARRLLSTSAAALILSLKHKRLKILGEGREDQGSNPLPVIQSDQFKSKVSLKQIDAIKKNKSYSSILKALDKAVEKGKDDSAEAKTFAERLRQWIAQRQTDVLEQSKTTPARSYTEVQDFMKQVKGLEEEAALKDRFSELKKIKSISTIVSTMKKRDKINESLNKKGSSKSTDSALLSIVKKMKLFLKKKGQDEILMAEAQAFLEEMVGPLSLE